jgi:tetratricopeptide (TPR) repeat protein
MKIPAIVIATLLITLLTGPVTVMADIHDDVSHLQTRWAEVNYQLSGKVRLTAFEQLLKDAGEVTGRYPDRAEAWIWRGIIQSTYAGARGGVGALKFAREARSSLETAIHLDDKALSGSAYTSLGALYLNVPGWPVGFGDDDRAEEFFKKAIALDPRGIDSNYFYGDYLLRKKRYDEARDYLLQARAAAPRSGRTLADAGRQKEITEALAKIPQIPSQ